MRPDGATGVNGTVWLVETAAPRRIALRCDRVLPNGNLCNFRFGDVVSAAGEGTRFDFGPTARIVMPGKGQRDQWIDRPEVARGIAAQEHNVRPSADLAHILECRCGRVERITPARLAALLARATSLGVRTIRI